MILEDEVRKAHDAVGRLLAAAVLVAADGAARADATLANVLYYPAPNVFLGPEIQWGRREGFRDTSDDVRVQFSVKYSFKHQLGGK